MSGTTSDVALPAVPGGGIVVSADWVIIGARSEPCRGWAVRVADGRIDDVGPAVQLHARYPDDDRHHGSGCVLMPGFVNAHVHSYGVLAHGVPAPANPPSDFWSFLADYWWPLVEDRLDHEMITAATRWVTAELAAGGTTCFFDILEAPNALPGVLQAEREVVETSGLRGILSFEATERMDADNGQAGIDENASFIRYCQAAAGRSIVGPGGQLRAASRVSGAMCIHTTFTCSEAFIRQAFDLAAELGVFCHAHVNEGVHEPQRCEQQHGMRTLEHYARLGVVSPRFQASQCVQISPAELDIIAGNGIRVSHMPLSNCEVGAGIAPLPEMLDRNVTVGLGSDGYINDMFAVMRGAFLVHRAATLNPGAVSAETVLHLATQGAAETLGLERVGRLEPGWHADLQLVVVDDLSGPPGTPGSPGALGAHRPVERGRPAGLPTPVEAHNLAEQLVLWRSASHVRDVMVGGDWIVSNGAVLGTDVGELRAHVREQAARLWS